MFEHLSVSNINDFIERKARWYLSRVRGIQMAMGVAAHRGTAVEAGVVHGLITNCQHNDSADVAMQKYWELCTGMNNDDVAKASVAIPAMVEGLIERLHRYGRPLSTQNKVGGVMEQTGEIPWVGYTDIEFEEVIVDIKTKGTTPSSLPAGWRRQGAFYSRMSNKPVIFVYATATKTVKIGDFEILPEDLKSGMSELAYFGKAAVDVAAMPEDIAAVICAPQPDDWMLRDQEFEAHAARVWPYLSRRSQ